MIDSYSMMVERNTRELKREKEQVEKLLLNMMPRSVYEEYKTFGVVTPRHYAPVSVLTVDFAGFSEMVERSTPRDRQRAQRHLHRLRPHRRAVRLRAHQDDRRHVRHRRRRARPARRPRRRPSPAPRCASCATSSAATRATRRPGAAGSARPRAR
jgi:hypothetical protein